MIPGKDGIEYSTLGGSRVGGGFGISKNQTLGGFAPEFGTSG